MQASWLLCITVAITLRQLTARSQLKLEPKHVQIIGKQFLLVVGTFEPREKFGAHHSCVFGISTCFEGKAPFGAGWELAGESGTLKNGNRFRCC